MEIFLRAKRAKKGKNVYLNVTFVKENITKKETYGDTIRFVDKMIIKLMKKIIIIIMIMIN
jgi:hypothetical protein